MKLQLLCVAAIIGLTSGCAEFRRNAGASAENDQNVLTGGPITGTRIKDLPAPVQRTLNDRSPSSEIADIDKTTKDGRMVYRIVFSEPGKNPTLFIADDGSIMEKMK